MSFRRTQLVPEKYFYKDKSNVILKLESWIESEGIGKTDKKLIYAPAENFWKIHLEDNIQKVTYGGFEFSSLIIDIDQGFYFSHPFDANLFSCSKCNYGFLSSGSWVADLKKGSLIKCDQCHEITDVLDIPNIESEFGFSNVAVVLEDFSAEISISSRKALESIFCSDLRILYQNM